MSVEGIDGSTSPLRKTLFHSCQQQVGQENTAELLDQWLHLHFFTQQNSWFNCEKQTPTWCNLTVILSLFLSLSPLRRCGLFSRQNKQTIELPRKVSQQQTNKTFLLFSPMVSARQTPKQCLHQTQRNFDTKNCEENNWRQCYCTVLRVFWKVFITWPARERRWALTKSGHL